MKVAIILMLLGVVYLFYPTYDLVMKDGTFATEVRLVGRDYLSLESCVVAAEAEEEGVYSCIQKSNWKQLFGGYRLYNREFRGISKELSETLSWRHNR